MARAYTPLLVLAMVLFAVAILEVSRRSDNFTSSSRL